MRPFAPLLVLLILPLAARAADPSPAFCTVMRGGETVEGACSFTPREGGSFDIRMNDGPIQGADSLSLDVATRGHGTVRAGGDPWGAAVREDSDPACWKGEGFTLCARAPGDARPDPDAVDPAHKNALAARCHMGVCNWVDQTAAREIGKGTAAVPGRLVEVIATHAQSEHDGEYPPGPPPGLTWSTPQPARYFCSTARPAFQQDDGSWFVLPLPNVWGVTEAVTTTYLDACHRGSGVLPDEAALRKLGYTVGEPKRDSYPDFAALTRP